jgi:hypothetical protein
MAPHVRARITRLPPDVPLVAVLFLGPRAVPAARRGRHGAANRGRVAVCCGLRRVTDRTGEVREKRC